MTVYGTLDAELQTATVSFNIDGMAPSEVGLRLDDEYGIMCRVGLHCAPAAHRTLGTFPAGTVRFGLGAFEHLCPGGRGAGRRREAGPRKSVMNEYSLILVWTSSHAIRVEHILNQTGIACKLIPTPRYLTSDCGISVRIAREDAGTARKALDEARAQYEDIRDLEG